MSVPWTPASAVFLAGSETQVATLPWVLLGGQPGKKMLFCQQNYTFLGICAGKRGTTSSRKERRLSFCTEKLLCPGKDTAERRQDRGRFQLAFSFSQRGWGLGAATGRGHEEGAARMCRQAQGAYKRVQLHCGRLWHGAGGR